MISAQDTQLKVVKQIQNQFRLLRKFPYLLNAGFLYLSSWGEKMKGNIYDNHYNVNNKSNNIYFLALPYSASTY